MNAAAIKPAATTAHTSTADTSSRSFLPPDTPSLRPLRSGAGERILLVAAGSCLSWLNLSVSPGTLFTLWGFVRTLIVPLFFCLPLRVPFFRGVHPR